MKALVQILVAIVLIPVLIGCSGVKFDNQSGTTTPSRSPAAASTSQPGGDSTSGQITQGAGPNGGDVSSSGAASGIITGTGSAGVADLPKVKFIGPPCMRLTECEVTFQLDSGCD